MEPGQARQHLTSADEWHLPFELTKAAVLALVLTDNSASSACYLLLECLVAPLELRKDNLAVRAV